MSAGVQTTAIAALEVVPFAMLIADASGQVMAVNQRWIELSGLRRAPSLGTGWLSVVEPDSRGRLRADAVRVGREGGSATADYQLGGPPNGRWTRWWISRHELEGTGLVAIAVADVHDDYARQANLYHLATHDSLTGLINRSHFIESIDQALRRNQRLARHVGVVYVDLDGFKRVNDRGGHSLGDRVLFAIGARLRHAVRSADMVARIGGDEFAVLCEGLNEAEQADVVARRIGQALTESVDLDGERWAVVASVGAAVDMGGPDTAEELVDRADRAMYTVKLSRRTSADRDDDRAGASPQAVALRERDDDGPAATPDPGTPSPVRRWEDSRRPAAPVGSPTPPSPVPSPVPSPAADTAKAAETAEPQPAPALEPEPAGDDDPARSRLLNDVVTLRESIESIRRMLDRLLTTDQGAAEARERREPPNRD
ncbi:MAG: diguanylate cyclase [Acidimicrobiales bacterium]|nr:diguanylate cyclase [Acidimicrobiales bacterium]